MVLRKVTTRRSLPNITLDVCIILTTSSTFSPVASLFRMFDHMMMAYGITFVITGAADTGIGERLVQVLVIAHGTVAAVSDDEWALFAAETAIGT